VVIRVMRNRRSAAKRDASHDCPIATRCIESLGKRASSQNQ
jgi:hypothetical protein